MQALPLALMAAGKVVQGIGGYQAGKYNRKVANANANNEIIEGDAQANRIRDLSRIAAGRQLGAQAESGFEVGTGSAIDSLVESQTNSELDAMDAERTAKSRYNAYRAEGQQAYLQGKNQLFGSLVGAAASVAGGAQDYATARGGS